MSSSSQVKSTPQLQDDLSLYTDITSILSLSPSQSEFSPIAIGTFKELNHWNILQLGTFRYISCKSGTLLFLNVVKIHCSTT